MASQSGFPSSYDPSKYYDPEIQIVREPARTILEKYSKIPNERIADHINEVVRLREMGNRLCILANATN